MMLFVIVMEAFNYLFLAASRENLLSPFCGDHLAFHASFVDDVVVFIRP